MACSSKQHLKGDDIAMLLESELTEETYADSEQDTDEIISSSDDESGDDENNDNPLFPGAQDEEVCGDSVSSSGPFVWEDMQNYNGRREVFSGLCGPQMNAQGMTDIVGIFELFFSEDIVVKIAEETNRYAQQYKDSKGNIFPKRSRVHEWVPVTEKEIYVVISIFMLMGIIQKPTLRLYFARNQLVATPIFGSIISLDRFESICRFLHFTDNTTIDTYQGPPKLFKIHLIIAHLNSKFQALYLPSQNISVDESLTLWKGRLSFKQYLPLKSSKFGIKTFELCESSSGYLWSFIVYTGKGTIIQSHIITENMNKTTAIVLKLLEPLLHKGYTVWMDNFYNSPALARTLKAVGTDCVGTLKLNRKGVPKKVKETKLKKGELIGQHAGPVSVIKWHDKKIVTTISTFHSDETRTVYKRGQNKEKPVSVCDYNQHMGGVDKKDQLLQMYLVERKRMNKWYMKLFRRLLNATVLNALTIYRHNVGRNVDHLKFRIDLIEGLFVKYAMERKVPGRRGDDNTVRRLIERHFPKRIPPTEKKSKPTRRCVVCSKHGKRRETVYHCRDCDVALCVDECFEDYHTKKNF